jgi:predicted permease
MALTTTIREWLVRMWGALRPGRRDGDLADELRLHLELSAEQARRRGASAAAASRIAVMQSGNLTQSLDAMRDQRGLPWLEDVVRDLRYGLRTLRRNPLFAIVAVLTLALGIGANTAIFSLADAVLLRALPVANPHELVMLRQRGPSGDIWPFSSVAAESLAGGHEALAGLAVFRPTPNAHVTVNDETDLALIQAVSGNYHAVLGIRAQLGRTFVGDERGAVAVISHRAWQRWFASDPATIGRTIDVQGRAVTIVGVTPPEFFGTVPGRHVDVTVALAAQTTRLPPNARWLYLIGRLAPGVTREQALAALRVRWAQLGDSVLPSRLPVTLELDPGAQGLNELRREFSRPLHILMAVVSVVLLVACANLAGLLIVRSSTRQQEIAVRLSMGAERGRIARQLLTESALLSVMGGAAGIAVAFWTTDLLLAMMSRGRTPILLDVAPNARTMGYALGLTLLTTVLFGLLPAIAAGRVDVHARLKQSMASGERARRVWARVMVSAQIALLVLLLATAGLFARTLHKLRTVDSGFRQDEVLVVNVSTGSAFRGASARSLYDDLYRRFSALAAVRSISMTMDTPLGGEPSMISAGIRVAGRPADLAPAPTVYSNIVGPRFFETMGIPVLSGRDFDVGDDERAPRRVIVSDGVVRRYFAGEDPIGRAIVFGDVEASIIGVVRDIRFTSLRAEPPLITYYAARQETRTAASTFLIRTSADAAAAVMPQLRAEVQAAAPALPPPSVVRLDDRVAAGLREERMLASLSSALGVLASLLAAIGIYSTVASSVVRRQREIAVRMALGAVPRQVAGLVVAEAFGIVAIGLAIGIPIALAAAVAGRSVVAGLLFELSPADPLVMTSAAVTIVILAAIAAYVPAHRASRVDPVAALKYE